MKNRRCPECGKQAMSNFKRCSRLTKYKCQHCESRLRITVAPALGLIVVTALLVFLLGLILQVIGPIFVFAVVILFFTFPLMCILPLEKISLINQKLITSH